MAFVTLADIEREAKNALPEAIAAYLFGGAGEEGSLRANRTALDALTLLPRMGRDLAGGTVQTEILGQTYDAPILAAPVAYQRLFHAEGEIGTARACAAFGLGYCLSSLSSTAMDAVRQAGEGAPQWFQLYAQPREEDTLALVRRAEEAGFCALVITLDAPVNGVRDRELNAGFSLPAGVSAVNLTGFAPPSPIDGHPVFDQLLQGAMTWQLFREITRATRLPVLAKGILHPDDARLALDAGAQGIIVSNHGGRTVDGVIPAIAALPPVVEAVKGCAPVLFDSGIRRGTDVLKALVLGARGVLVGRPLVGALACGGAPSVARAIRLLMDEFVVALALSGVRSPSEISPALISNAARLTELYFDCNSQQ